MHQSSSSSSSPSLEPTSNSKQASKPKRAPKLMNHITWQRKGHADDDPSSPFHTLHISHQEREHTGPIKDRNYSLLNHPSLTLPTSLSSSSSPSLVSGPRSQPVSTSRDAGNLASSSYSNEYWSRSFLNPSLPLIVDIGCGAGRFALLLAHLVASKEDQDHTSALQTLSSSLPLLHPHPPSDDPPLAFNVLGIDIQSALINRAMHWASNRPHLRPHLHYCVANANTSTSQLLESYPGPIALACIQYPDPHQRTQRHVVNMGFVADLAGLLKPGARVLLQSELEATAGHMRDEFELYGSHAFTSLNPAKTRIAPSEDAGTSTDSVQLQAQSHPAKLSYTGGTRERSMDSNLPPMPPDQLHDQLTWGRDYGWLNENPLGNIPTEREVYMRQELPGENVYRFFLSRI